MKNVVEFCAKFVLILSIAVSLCFTVINPTWASNESAKYVADELLVKPRVGISKSEIEEILKAHSAAAAGEIKQIKVRRIKVPSHALEKVKAALAKNPHIEFVENNFIADRAFEPNDSRYPSQWHLQKISAPYGWDLCTGSQTVSIAIIDSGVDPAHPDLSDKLLPGYNFLNESTDTHDVCGHGTAVAGSAAAISNNVEGVAGVAWENPIMPLVVVNPDNWATYYDIARAITYAADHGARVMNISIGGSSSSSTLQNAINYAWNKGAVIFACAHNYSTSRPYYPAACANAVAVSATTWSDSLASFSNYGNWIDISAPGLSILTTTRGGGYGYKHGTSFSSPIAAGLAALILSINPSLTNTQVLDIIIQNVDDLGEPGFDQYYGYGRVNVYASLIAAMQAVSPPDTTEPSVSITSPEEGSVVSGLVTVCVSATDNVGIESVELYIDGMLFDTRTTAPYNFTWDTRDYPEGNHELFAVACDTSGNIGQSNYSTVYVNNDIPEDTIAPDVSITSPEEGSVVSGLVTVCVSATDNVGIESVELYIDGMLFDTRTTAPYNFTWDTRDYPEGNYELLAIAHDGSGNTGRSSYVTVYNSQDTTPPTVTITSPSDGSHVSKLVKVSISASDDIGISKIELYLDGALKVIKYESSLSWNWNTRKISKGEHIISTRAYDTEGNIATDSITVYK